MNILNEKKNTSDCIISFNEYNQFVLKSADSTFLQYFGLSERSIDSAIKNILPKELNECLSNLYINNHNSDGAFTKCLKVSSPCCDNCNIYLSVTLYNIGDSVKFICKPLPVIEDNLGTFSSFNCCSISSGKITAMSKKFFEFIESFNIDLETFTESDALITSEESNLPDSKILIFNDNLQPYIFMTTAIPSSNPSECDYILFINKVPSENKLTKLLDLTPREFEAVRLASKGYTNRSIADTLNIAEGSVARLLSNSYSKLQISSKLEIYGKL